MSKRLLIVVAAFAALAAPLRRAGRHEAADALLARARLLRAARPTGCARGRRPGAHAGDRARPLPALPPDRTFLARSDDGSRERRRPSRAQPRDWTVKPAGSGLSRSRRSRRSGRVLERGGRRHRAARGPGATAGQARGSGSHAATGCADYPRGRARRDRHAREGQHLVRRGRRPARGPHALDDLRVPRRQVPLRPPVAPVRHPLRAAGLLVDRGAAGHHRDRSRTSSTTATPRSRTTRAATRADGVVGAQPHVRGHLLALGAARLDGRPAADGHGRQREPRPLRAPGQPRRRTATRWTPCAAGSRPCTSCRTTSTRRPAAPARASSRSSPTRTTRAGSSTRAGWRWCSRSRSPSCSTAATSRQPTCDQAAGRPAARRDATTSASARCCC